MLLDISVQGSELPPTNEIPQSELELIKLANLELEKRLEESQARVSSLESLLNSL